MALFSVAQRREAMDYIVSAAKENPDIAALIAVGSGSYGYNDELSDLDMVIAVYSDEKTAAVKDYIAARLNERYGFIYFKQAQQVPLQVYLTDNFLEIDIGYGAYTYAAAFKEHWKVLFDKTGTVDGKMRQSWEAISAAPKTDNHNAKLAECSDAVWHHLMHAAVAIKRGQSWRAAAELDVVRGQLIGLLGIRYSLDTSGGKDTDKLPEAELAALEKTLVKGFSEDALLSALDELTKLVYDELERFGERSCIRVTRSQVEEYIAACRK